MNNTIFYSWQTDCSRITNKDFIRECIDRSLQTLGIHLEAEDAPRLETGMEGTPGTPEVATIMFNKIGNCSIFICDVSLTGQCASNAKKYPNPNVSLEMGYAAGTIGWERIICIMNEYHGRRDALPFDMRNRRFPINYTYDPADRTPETKARVAEGLTRDITFAIRSSYEYSNQLVDKAISGLDVNALQLMRERFRQPYFSEPVFPNTMFGVLERANFRSTVIRLLDLGILKADINEEATLYAYHWTYLGTQANNKLFS